MIDIGYVGNTALTYILRKIKTIMGGYVKKESGKGLSEMNFTAEDAMKLEGIPAGATKVAWRPYYYGGTKVLGILYLNDQENKIYLPQEDPPTIDDEMSWYSSNAVKNHVIKEYVDDQISQAVDDIYENITSIEIQQVNFLPSEGRKGVIYLVPIEEADADNNTKDEYIWLEDDARFEKIGTTDIDLTGYLQESDISEVLSDDIDALVTSVFGE